jgi:glycyl-tRNA synthetase beta chain
VPPECLILTMKANQKYFPLLDGAGRLTNRFLIVANISPADASAIVDGNERVVRPRLADAKFFFDQDRKKKLEDRVADLARVVYHSKLGSQRERVERVRSIARGIGTFLGGDAALLGDADRAALLAKADLLTDMVGEFPELQGVMGGYYARHDGEGEAVALAIEDHYRPRFAGDALPRNDAGVVLALADKLETLTGLFGVGEKPSGDKDPYALRRHALGAIRLLAERALPLELDALLQLALAAFGESVADAREALAEFIYERLAGSLREQGYSAQQVDAVLSVRPGRLADVERRLAAVRAFAALPESASLAAANKRVGNILKKAEPGAVGASVDAALLVERAEAALHGALREVQPSSDAAFERADYAASLQALAALKTPVDAFFDDVMVNVDDAKLRANRLALLASLHGAMNRVADLSKLAG